MNLLELEELKSLIKQIETNSKLSALTKKEQAKYVFDLFQDLAKQRKAILKLNRRVKNNLPVRLARVTNLRVFYCTIEASY